MVSVATLPSLPVSAALVAVCLLGRYMRQTVLTVKATVSSYAIAARGTQPLLELNQIIIRPKLGQADIAKAFPCYRARASIF